VGRLILGLELVVVLADKALNLGRHPKEPDPLLLVEGHRESPQPVNRDRAFLANLYGHACPRRLLERFVFLPQALEFGAEIPFRHSNAPIAVSALALSASPPKHPTRSARAWNPSLCKHGESPSDAVNR